jgi:hypothetical protein
LPGVETALDVERGIALISGAAPATVPDPDSDEHGTV